MGRSIPDRATVTADWTASYTPALKVARGQPLTCHHTDPENPGWRWTTDATGLGGWLPEGLVQNGYATADFDSTELTATAGTPVIRLQRLGGWTLCETPDGTTGWLPDSHLASL